MNYEKIICLTKKIICLTKKKKNHMPYEKNKYHLFIYMNTWFDDNEWTRVHIIYKAFLSWITLRKNHIPYEKNQDTLKPMSIPYKKTIHPTKNNSIRGSKISTLYKKPVRPTKNQYTLQEISTPYLQDHTSSSRQYIQHRLITEIHHLEWKIQSKRDIV